MPIPAALTYRERFARTLAHQPVDRPPMELGSTDLTDIEGGPRRLARVLGVLPAGSPAETDEAVLRMLDTDIRGVGGILSPASPLVRQLSPTRRVDAWGITYQWIGDHYEAVGRPLAGATLDDLDRYPWPDPDRIDPAEIEAIATRAKALFEQTDYVVCARHPVYGISSSAAGCAASMTSSRGCRRARRRDALLRSSGVFKSGFRNATIARWADTFTSPRAATTSALRPDR